MTQENAHSFDKAIAAFAHASYELVPTGEVYDGAERVHELLTENLTGFPDFSYRPEQMHYADDAIIVEGTFTGTQDGPWRGLPPTGRKVAFPMLIIFRFAGEAMMGERIFFDLLTVFEQLGVARDPNSLGGKIAIAVGHPLTLGRAVLRSLIRRARR
jgi:predicted ester cyclase